MGCFITFEGIEGCGKSTQIRKLASLLEEQGKKVTLTREPGGCGIADQIRAILLDSANSAMVPLTELLLYAAARAQHISEVIKPALAKGDIVLCDRFIDATIAYQGHGRRLDLELINSLNILAAGDCRPDLTLLLDCPVATGLERALARIEALGAFASSTAREERFERESLEFHERVRSGYLSLAASEPERFCVIDASGTVDEIFAAIESRLVAKLAS
ncbi:MAG: dTMP kinase [Geobacter sp.]|nr:dTMP kinase [Geobacter sp.]